MASNSVARAPNGSNVSRESGDGIDLAHDELRRHCARLLAQGFSAKQVGTALASRLNPNANERSAVVKLKRWMRRDASFRDLIFSEAVTALDLKTPLILGGIAKSAIAGRVDAAKLALEVTGRHTSHEAPVTNVAIVLNNVRRPGDE